MAQDLQSTYPPSRDRADLRPGDLAFEFVGASSPDPSADGFPNGPTIEGGGRLEPAQAAASAIRVLVMGRPIEVKVASEREEFEQAFRLLAAKYQARGYEEPSTKVFRFTSYHVLPETMTFVAKERDRVVATLSLVPDTRLLGLPMEAIYGPEVAGLRRAGLRLGEVTSLADHDLSPREFLPVFMALIRLVLQYHVRHGGDAWLITVNPRHSRFYRKGLGFEPLGSRRSYPSVQDHPAEAFRLDRELLRANAPEKDREFFGEPLPEAALRATVRPLAHARYFGGRSTQVDGRSLEDLLLMVEHSLGQPRWVEEDGEGMRPEMNDTLKPNPPSPDDPESDVPWDKPYLEEVPNRRRSIRFPVAHDQVLLHWEHERGVHTRTALPIDLSRAAVLLEVDDPPQMEQLVKLGLKGPDGTAWIGARVVRLLGPRKVTLAFAKRCDDYFFWNAVFGAR